MAHHSTRHSRSVASALAGVALVALACTTPTGLRTALPTLEPGDTDPAAGFEIVRVVDAHDLLPRRIRTGPHYEVEDRVESDGFLRIYTIESDFGHFEARGDDLLRIRIREIEALATLDETSQTEEFAHAVVETLKSPFVATWNLVTNPVDSLVGLPVGAWEQIKRTAQLTRGERGELEDSAIAEFIGFEARKREIAHRLGVDPYSSNPALQSKLNRVAWVTYLGGLPSMFVPFSGGSPAEDDIPAPASGDRLSEMLLDYSPEDLRRLNRIEMSVMGIPEASRDAFVTHEWYSPRHQTVLVGALAELDLTRDRGIFIDTAVTARSEDDAFFYQRTAELLHAYHLGAEPLERILALDGTVAGYTSSGRLVVPLMVDHAIWSRPTAEFAQSLATTQLEGIRVSKREVVVSGTLSDLARKRFRALGITVTEEAFEQLAPRPTAAAGAATR